MATLGRLHDHSLARYLASFRAFRNSVVMKEVNYLQALEPKVPSSCETGADVRVLGIGSGSGEVDSVILKKILQSHSSVYNRVVEPSDEMVQRYKTLVRGDTSLSAVKFDWRQQTAEEYFQTNDSTKFHLVHAVHVLYDVEDIHATLRNMWEQPKDGGHLLVTIKSDKCDWGKLWYKLWEDFGQGDRLKTSFRTSNDVRQWLDTAGISYVAFEDEFKMDITECFKEESEEGRMILDFLTQTPYVSSEPEIMSNVLEYLRCNSTVVGDKILLNSINETIVAMKSSTGYK